MRTYPMTSGQRVTFLRGTSFVVDQAPFAVDITFINSNGESREVPSVKQGTVFKPAGGFESVIVTCNVDAVYGFTSFDGDIENYRNDKREFVSFEGKDFIYGVSWSALPSYRSVMSLVNPVGSGVLVALMRSSVNGAGDICNLWYNTRAYIDSQLIPINLTNPKPKLLSDMGGSVNKAEAGASIITTAWDVGDVVDSTATDVNKTPSAFNYENSPFIIPEGYGLSWVQQLTGFEFVGRMEWREIPIT